MGLFKRIHRITLGRISALLERVEDPEVLFPQLVREMEQQVQAATEQEASAVAAVRRAEVKIDRMAAKIETLGRGAAQALKQGREDIAREALGGQIDAEQELERMRSGLASLCGSRDLATASRKQIARQLDELRARKQALLARSRLAKARKNIQQTVNGTTISGGSILDAVARMEEQVEETEAELEVQARLAGDATVNPALAQSLAELDQAEQIDQRLAALKARLNRPVSPPANGAAANL